MKNKRLIIIFAKRWDVHPSAIVSIIEIFQVTGEYGKTGRIVRSLGTPISTRRIMYFIKRMKLDDRIEFNKKGRPGNYRKLLRQI